MMSIMRNDALIQPRARLETQVQQVHSLQVRRSKGCSCDGHHSKIRAMTTRCSTSYDIVSLRNKRPSIRNSCFAISRKFGNQLGLNGRIGEIRPVSHHIYQRCNKRGIGVSAGANHKENEASNNNPCSVSAFSLFLRDVAERVRKEDECSIHEIETLPTFFNESLDSWNKLDDEVRSKYNEEAALGMPYIEFKDTVISKYNPPMAYHLYMRDVRHAFMLLCGVKEGRGRTVTARMARAWRSEELSPGVKEEYRKLRETLTSLLRRRSQESESDPSNPFATPIDSVTDATNYWTSDVNSDSKPNENAIQLDAMIGVGKTGYALFTEIMTEKMKLENPSMKSYDQAKEVRRLWLKLNEEERSEWVKGAANESSLNSTATLSPSIQDISVTPSTGTDDIFILPGEDQKFETLTNDANVKGLEENSFESPSLATDVATTYMRSAFSEESESDENQAGNNDELTIDDVPDFSDENFEDDSIGGFGSRSGVEQKSEFDKASFTESVTDFSHLGGEAVEEYLDEIIATRVEDPSFHDEYENDYLPGDYVSIREGRWFGLNGYVQRVNGEEVWVDLSSHSINGFVCVTRNDILMADEENSEREAVLAMVGSDFPGYGGSFQWGSSCASIKSGDAIDTKEEMRDSIVMLRADSPRGYVVNEGPFCGQVLLDIATLEEDISDSLVIGEQLEPGYGGESIFHHMDDFPVPYGPPVDVVPGS